MKRLRRARGLIALQMSDQMPVPLQIRQRGQLPFPLLHAVFTEMPQPGGKRLAHRFRGMRFGNADQQNLLRLAAGTKRRGVNLFPHAF